MTNDGDMSSMRLRNNQPKDQYKINLDTQRMEGFKCTRLLYIINNMPTPEVIPLASPGLSSKTSDANEDVELLLKEMMNKKELEENKIFGEKELDEYESLRNLRIKRMRDSVESPVFGSNRSSYQSQRSLIRGLTITSKDELEKTRSK